MADSDPNDTALEELEKVNDELDELEIAPTQPRTLEHIISIIERREVIAALKRTNGVGVRAARELGISRDKFNRRMKRFGLVAKHWRRRYS